MAEGKGRKMSSNKGRRSYNGDNAENIRETGSTSGKRSKGGKRLYQDNGAAQVTRSRAQEDKPGTQTPRKAKKKTSGGKKAVIVICVILAVLLVVAAVAAVFIKTYIKAPKIPNKTRTEIDADQQEPHEQDVSIDGIEERAEGCYTFLLFGTDKGGGNTDTIMVVKYDVTNQQINVMSIPRDTCVNVSAGLKKINAVYSNNGGASGGGVAALEKEIKKILGFSVDYYIRVDLTAFEKVVDAIGGVDFDVPVNMNYYDPTQNLQINIPKGMQHLNGENALKVARFRSGYASADIGRIDTQQKLMKAIAEQTLKLSNIGKVDDFVKIFKEYVDTDLSLGELTWLATQMMSVDSANINFMTMPGNTGATIKGLSYVTIYVNKLVEMVNEYFNPYDTPITASNLNILTLDANGNYYSTTGSIAGGFTDYTSITGLGTSTGGDENQDETPPEDTSGGEEETTSPGESAGGETDTPPEDGVTNTEPIGGTVEGTITIEGTEGTGVIDNAA